MYYCKINIWMIDKKFIFYLDRLVVLVLVVLNCGIIIILINNFFLGSIIKILGLVFLNVRFGVYM